VPAGPPGVIAPDGSVAAVIRIVAGRVTLHLINLASGADRQVTVSLDEGSAGDQTLAWSPDSRWLFIIAAHGITGADNPMPPQTAEPQREHGPDCLSGQTSSLVIRIEDESRLTLAVLPAEPLQR
jgi:hypothetical protein